MTQLNRLAYRGLFAAVAMLLNAAGADVWADPPKDGAAPPAPPTKESLDALLIAYKTYDLPFPPDEARLVRYPVGRRTFREDGTEHEFHGLGFLLNRLKPGEDRVFGGLGGIREIQDWKSVRLVEPKVITLANIDVVSVELAVQCHARGWTKLALAVLEWRAIDDDRLPAKQLAEAAWSYWQSKILEPDSDRAKVARQLKVILEHRGDDFGKAERNLLRLLELALVPGKGKPGTVDAAIDSLIDVTETDQSGYMGTGTPDATYLKAARLGFAAVPALIDHLDDERLTRARKDPLNNFRGYYYRVGDVVSDLLQGLAGGDLGKDWLRRQQGYRLEKSDVEKWWSEANNVGEEAHFVRHALRVDKDGNLRNRVMLDVLAHKYPRQLPALYRKFLEEKPTHYGRCVADAVAESSLPDATKVELFNSAAKNQVLSFRQDAILHLRKLDPAKALELLIAELKNLPATPQEAYWRCPESRFASFVRNWNEPTAWAALEAAAQRVDVGLRMELLNNVVRRDLPDSTRKAVLSLLSKFLDDDEVRVATGPKYDGPYAGVQELWRIEVRNFVAQEAAWILDLDVEPRAKWTDEDWSDFRDQVKKALAREGIK